MAIGELGRLLASLQRHLEERAGCVKADPGSEGDGLEEKEAVGEAVGYVLDHEVERFDDVAALLQPRVDPARPVSRFAIAVPLASVQGMYDVASSSGSPRAPGSGGGG